VKDSYLLFFKIPACLRAKMKIYGGCEVNISNADKTTWVPGLHRRYSDAYAIASGLVQLGRIVKYVSMSVGGLVAFMSLFMLLQQTFIFILFAAVGIIVGIMVGFFGFAAGVMISAQGQIMLAMIDTAVNTSPLVSATENAYLIGLDNSKTVGVVGAPAY
jgi:hypothetical protein